MNTRFVVLAAFAMACTGDLGTKDTGTTTTPDGECPNGQFDGEVGIDTATATCSGGTQIRYNVRTIGPVSFGRVFAQETGNIEPNWSDNHELEVVQSDACGDWDELEVRVSAGSSVADWQENVSSVFTCDGHIGDGDVMTYAFAVYDNSGDQIACVAYGHDPDGMINGNYDRVNPPLIDLDECDRGVNTMAR